MINLSDTFLQLLVANVPDKDAITVYRCVSRKQPCVSYVEVTDNLAGIMLYYFVFLLLA
jgi:hypothetical protein